MLLSYLYTSIGVKLWRRQMPGNVDVNRDLTMQCKRVKVSCYCAARGGNVNTRPGSGPSKQCKKEKNNNWALVVLSLAARLVALVSLVVLPTFGPYGHPNTPN